VRRILRMTVFTQVVVWTLVLTTLATGLFPPEGRAMLAPPSATASEAGTDQNRATDLQKIQSVLETKVVQQRLMDYGLSQDEINARLNQLSDAQLHQVATQIDAMIPAGDGLGIVIALLVIAILAIILVYLLNHRIVVTK
jgi:hypothetical protein